MPENTWERAKMIFDKASQRSPAERSAYLDGACHGDIRLRAEVDTLLEAHDAAGSNRTNIQPSS